MIRYIIYLISLIRFKWILFNKKRLNRFDNYSPDADVFEHDVVGLIANKTDWDHSTPNLERKENVSIIASNTFDKSALNLNFKWRPNSKLNVTTLLSRLSLEVKGKYLDYDNVTTYVPRNNSSIQPDRITQYGANGSCLKLYIIEPYKIYRIVFRGYMRKRSSFNERNFVKLNLLVFQTSKLYDFQEQFDADYLAHQVATKRPKFNLGSVLNGLVLHDRHEQTVRLLGEYIIHEADTKNRDKLHLWGFHSRQVVEDKTEKLRNKRILGHFNNGRAFHIGVCENIDNNFDPDQQFNFGYVCFRITAAIASICRCKNPIKWDQVKSSSLKLNFNISGQGSTFQVKANRQELASEFMSMSLDSTPGWGIIVINDSLETSQDLHAINISLREYQNALKEDKIINTALLNEKQFTTKPIVVNIDDPDCLYTNLVGAKASSLAILRAHSLADNLSKDYIVPSAVMLTRFAYEIIQETNPNLKDEIRVLEARVGRGNLIGLEHDCEKVQRLFEQEIKLPEMVREELGEQVKKHFKLNDLESLESRSFAVRSSSWGEDEEDMSAAGQLTTVLGVKGFERLVEAVMKCFASKFSYTNIEYKRQHGLPLDLPMAVVVQEMIDCDKAGVLFTCDPTTGDDGYMTINANYGLGESVVSGQTDPDTIRIRIDQQVPTNSCQDLPSSVNIEEIKIGGKNVILNSEILNLDNSSYNDSEYFDGITSKYDSNKCCLTNQEVIQLSDCGVELAHYFESPRDIEWGYKDGLLYLFQSRPVTGLEAYSEFELMHEGDMPSRAEVEFTTRANVGEVMPYAITPFELSFPIKFWSIVMDQFLRKLKKVDLEDYTLNISSGTIIYNYHIFFSLRGKGLFNFARNENEEKNIVSRAMEIGIFGHEVKNQELCEKATEMSSSDREVRFEEQRFSLMTMKQRYMPWKLITKARKQMVRLRRDINSLRYAKKGSLSPMEGLFEQMRKVFKYGRQTLLNHIVCTFISSKLNYELLQLLSNYIQDPTRLLTSFSKFLAFSPDVLSAEIPRKIERMAKLIKKRGARDIEAFVSMTPKEGLKYISNDMKSELAKEFDTFMIKFGHRCYHEFEISSTAWRETPETIIEMLQSNVKRYLNDDSPNVDEDDSSKKNVTLEDVIQSLYVKFSFLDRLRLKYLVAPRSQNFVSVREHTKDIAIELTDIQRDAAKLLARELRQNNRIPDEELFYFLFYREVEPLVRAPQPSIIIQAIKRRRMFKMFKQTQHYDEIMRGHEMIPSHLKPSKELDKKIFDAPKLHGTTASSGKIQGKVCLVNGYDELNKVEAGDILLTYSTDIAFSPIFPLLSGVITEIGGLISHGAVVAREYGLPSVIGISNITKILQHGEEIILDADNGAIIRLNHSV